MECIDVNEQLDAYALDTLDPEQRLAVEHHLADCADCQRLADGLTTTVAELPQALFAVAPRQPPPHVRERVLAAAAEQWTTPDDAVVTTPVEGSLGSAWGSADEAGATPQLPRPWVPFPRFGWTIPGPVTRVAVVVLLLLALATSVRFGLALERERSQRIELATLVGQQEIVIEVVDSDQTVRRVLRTTEPDACEPGTCPYGKLFTRSDFSEVVAMAARLPQPPGDQSYALWLELGDETRLAGALTLDENGFGLLVFEAEALGPAYDAAYVTLQPEDGPTPAGDVVLRWDGA